MTDNEIIKALECCTNDHCTISCPMYNTTDVRLECKYLIAKYALDLINRQKAKIERLKERLNRSTGIDNTKENGCFPFD